MDALSQALSRIRLKSPLLSQLRLGRNLSLEMSDGTPPALCCPFHFVSAGSCRVVVGTEAWVLQENDLIVLPHWPRYRLETGAGSAHVDIFTVVADHHLPPWSPVKGLDEALPMLAGSAPIEATVLSGIFTLDSAQGESLLSDLPDRILLNAQADGLGGLLRASLQFIGAEAPGRPGYAASASRLLELLFVETLRGWVLATDHPTGRLRGMVDPRLAPVLSAIHSRPGHVWTLPKLASLAGQSRSKFCAHFLSAIGTTPAAYIGDWRCQIAERRLMRTDEPIAKLAAELGYGSAFSFSRAFRTLRGVTPAGYRKRLREQLGCGRDTSP